MSAKSKVTVHSIGEIRRIDDVNNIAQCRRMLRGHYLPMKRLRKQINIICKFIFNKVWKNNKQFWKYRMLCFVSINNLTIFKDFMKLYQYLQSFLTIVLLFIWANPQHNFTSMISSALILQRPVIDWAK